MPALILLLLLCVAGFTGYRYWQFESGPRSPGVRTVAKTTAQSPADRLRQEAQAFCQQRQEEYTSTIDAARANRAAMQASRKRMEAFSDDESEKLAVGQAVLEELKQLHATTSAAGAWPATYKGQRVDELWVRTSVNEVDDQVGLKKKRIALLKQQIHDAIASEQGYDRLEASAKQRLADLEFERQDAGVRDAAERLDELKRKFDPLAVPAVAAVRDQPRPVEIQASPTTAVPSRPEDDAKFQEIMTRK